MAHPVSQGRLCVKGWHAHELSLSQRRLQTPLLRKNGKLTAANWPQALQAAALGLGEIKRLHGPQAVAVLGSARCTNEANFVVMRFARQVLGTNNVDFPGRMDSPGFRFAFPAGCLENIDEADLIFLLEADEGKEHPAIVARLLRARRRGAKLVAVGLRRHRLARLADLHLQPLPGRHTEVIAGIIAAVLTDALATALSETSSRSLAPLLSRIADFTPEKAAEAAGVAVEQIRRAAAAFAQAKRPLVIVGRGAIRDPRGNDLFCAVSNLFALGQAMGQQPFGHGIMSDLLTLGARGNSRGAHEMGLAPTLLTGYQPLSRAEAGEAFENAWGARLPQPRGLSLWEMPGAVRGMLIMADDLIYSTPDRRKANELLEGLDFLVLQDSIAGELMERADVVLPATAFGEEDGTFTSLEGRLQRVEKLAAPPGEARPHWEIVCQLARQMGTHFGFRSPGEIMQQIAALTPLYQRVSYAALQQEQGSLLPTQILHEAESLPTSGLQLLPQVPACDPAFPLWLLVDFSASSWEGDPMVLSCPTLSREFSMEMKDFPRGYVDVSPSDAQRLGLRNGSKVRVIASNGEFTTSARLSEEVPAGVVLLPFFRREMALAVLEEKEGEEGLPLFQPVQVRIEGLP